MQMKGKEKLKIFDAHTHIGPDNYQLKLGKENFDITLKQLTTILEKNGIEGAIIMCSSSTYTVCPNYKCLSPSGPMRLKEKDPFILQCEDCGATVKTKPYFRANLSLFKNCKDKKTLFPFLTIDLRYPYLEEYIKFFISHFNVYGIKINCFAIRTSSLKLMEYKKLLSLFQERDFPLLIHATNSNFSPDDALELSNRSGLKVIIAHGPKIAERLLKKISASERTFVDLSPYLALCKKYGWEPREKLKKILDVVDYRKILFGSDIPFTADYTEEIEFWRNVELEEEVKKRILSLNAFEFLGIELNH